MNKDVHFAEKNMQTFQYIAVQQRFCSESFDGKNWKDLDQLNRKNKKIFSVGRKRIPDVSGRATVFYKGDRNNGSGRSIVVLTDGEFVRFCWLSRVSRSYKAAYNGDSLQFARRLLYAARAESRVDRKSSARVLVILLVMHSMSVSGCICNERVVPFSHTNRDNDTYITVLYLSVSIQFSSPVVHIKLYYY